MIAILRAWHIRKQSHSEDAIRGKKYKGHSNKMAKKN